MNPYPDNPIEDIAFLIYQNIWAAENVIKAEFMRDGSGYLDRKIATAKLMNAISEAVK